MQFYLARAVFGFNNRFRIKITIGYGIQIVVVHPYYRMKFSHNKTTTGFEKLRYDACPSVDIGQPTNGAVARKNNIEGFATYPNPITSDNFTITSNSADKKEVTIFNVLGKKVLSTTFSGTKSDINVATISSGIYILKVSEGSKMSTSKLIIK